jgi:hypothetical protein
MSSPSNGTGVSVATADKQDGFRKLVRLHARIVSQVWRKWGTKWDIPRNYVYIDTHCGSGEAGPYGPGSPVIFLQEITKLGLPFHAYFIDDVPANTAALRAHIEGQPHAQHCEIRTGDNEALIGPILNSILRRNQTFGLLYMDPYGLPSEPVLERAAGMARHIDLLIRIPTSVLKRTRAVFGVRTGHDEPDYLTNILRNKKAWMIREPQVDIGDIHQWIFLFGTNDSAWGEWTRERFHRIDSEEGQRILYGATFSHAECVNVYRHSSETAMRVAELSGGCCAFCLNAKAEFIYDTQDGANQDRAENLFHICPTCLCGLRG